MIHLREIRASDIDTIAELCNDKSIHDNTLFIPYPYTREDAVKFYETQGSKGHQYAICESGSDGMIGNISIMLNEKRGFEANIGYWLGKNHRNKGCMTAALVKIIEIIRSELNIRRIVATHDVANPASGRVMQKAGMFYEGSLKSYYLKNGRFVDECIYAYINEDFRYD